jgi:CDGSH-type Zn-finger protein
MNRPVIAAREPIAVEVKAGQSYWWCACGLSKRQPFCDGSHKAEGRFTPMEYKAELDRKVFFCACKQTGKSPLCDGTHKAV